VAAADHKAHAPAPSAIRIFVVTASDSRTPITNQGGQLIRELAERAGFPIVGETLLPDERDAIRQLVTRIIAEKAADAILLTGGTGIAQRDTTIEALGGLLEKRLDGFGELFRMLSFAEIGPAAMLSRAIGGTIGQTALFAMPGSPAGVRLAMERLILPELAHVIGELRRKTGSSGSTHAAQTPQTSDNVGMTSDDQHDHGHSRH
jgi:molybdopterin adenylyltransferase